MAEQHPSKPAIGEQTELGKLVATEASAEAQVAAHGPEVAAIEDPTERLAAMADMDNPAHPGGKSILEGGLLPHDSPIFLPATAHREAPVHTEVHNRGTARLLPRDHLNRERRAERAAFLKSRKGDSPDFKAMQTIVRRAHRRSLDPGAFAARYPSLIRHQLPDDPNYPYIRTTREFVSDSAHTVGHKAVRAAVAGKRGYEASRDTITALPGRLANLGRALRTTTEQMAAQVGEKITLQNLRRVGATGLVGAGIVLVMSGSVGNPLDNFNKPETPQAIAIAPGHQQPEEAISDDGPKIKKPKKSPTKAVEAPAEQTPQITPPEPKKSHDDDEPKKKRPQEPPKEKDPEPKPPKETPQPQPEPEQPAPPSPPAPEQPPQQPEEPAPGGGNEEPPTEEQPVNPQQRLL